MYIHIQWILLVLVWFIFNAIKQINSRQLRVRERERERERERGERGEYADNEKKITSFELKYIFSHGENI